jgi:hypothetical protein
MIYRLAQGADRLAEVRAYVEQVGHLWDRALDAFKAFAEQEDQE